MFELYIPVIFFCIPLVVLWQKYSKGEITGNKLFWSNFGLAFTALLIQYFIVKPYKAISSGIDLTHPSTLLLGAAILSSLWVTLSKKLQSEKTGSLPLKYIYTLLGLYFSYVFTAPISFIFELLLDEGPRQFSDILALLIVLLGPTIPLLIVIAWSIIQMKKQRITPLKAKSNVFLAALGFAIIEMTLLTFWLTNEGALALPFFWSFVIVGHGIVGVLGTIYISKYENN